MNQTEIEKQIADKMFNVPMIPELVFIGGIFYKVKMSEDYGNSDKNMGLFCQKTSSIYVKNMDNPAVEFKTFVHECIHAIISEYGVDIDSEKEEKIVDQLSNGIFELIKQFAK